MEERFNDSSSLDYLASFLKVKSRKLNRTQELISNLNDITRQFKNSRKIIANMLQESHLNVSIIECHSLCYM